MTLRNDPISDPELVLSSEDAPSAINTSTKSHEKQDKVSRKLSGSDAESTNTSSAAPIPDGKKVMTNIVDVEKAMKFASRIECDGPIDDTETNVDIAAPDDNVLVVNDTSSDDNIAILNQAMYNEALVDYQLSMTELDDMEATYDPDVTIEVPVAKDEDKQSEASNAKVAATQDKILPVNNESSFDATIKVNEVNFSDSFCEVKEVPLDDAIAIECAESTEDGTNWLCGELESKGSVLTQMEQLEALKASADSNTEIPRESCTFKKVTAPIEDSVISMRELFAVVKVNNNFITLEGIPCDIPTITQDDIRIHKQTGRDLQIRTTCINASMNPVNTIIRCESSSAVLSNDGTLIHSIYEPNERDQSNTTSLSMSMWFLLFLILLVTGVSFNQFGLYDEIWSEKKLGNFNIPTPPSASIYPNNSLHNIHVLIEQSPPITTTTSASMDLKDSNATDSTDSDIHVAQESLVLVERRIPGTNRTVVVDPWLADFADDMFNIILQYNESLPYYGFSTNGLGSNDTNVKSDEIIESQAALSNKTPSFGSNGLTDDLRNTLKNIEYQAVFDDSENSFKNVHSKDIIDHEF